MLEEHTYEELMIEMFEDYYDKNPIEADRFMAGADGLISDWDGRMPDYYNEVVQKELGEFFDKNKVDISRYQSEEELTSEEEQAIIDNLGKNLPKSKIISPSSPKEDNEAPVLGEEFEDRY